MYNILRKKLTDELGSEIIRSDPFLYLLAETILDFYLSLTYAQKRDKKQKQAPLTGTTRCRIGVFQIPINFIDIKFTCF